MLDTSTGSAQLDLATVLRGLMADDQLRTPSLPDVALQVGLTSQDDDITSAQLAAIVSRDPAIAARLIGVANAVGCRGAGVAVGTVNAAITRIGLPSTRVLTRCVAMEQMFHANTPVLAGLMHRIWRHSLETAAYAHALSEELDLFSPDDALTLGLLAQIGCLPALAGLDAHCGEDGFEPGAVWEAVWDVQALIGRRVLREWSLPDGLQSGMSLLWAMTRNDATASLADLVTVGFWQTCPVDHVVRSRLPRAAVTAYARLGLPQPITEATHPALLAGYARALARLGG